jgi:manganese oxidase
MRHLRRFGIMLLVLFSAALARPAENSSLPSVMANDNQKPAGQLKNGVLNLQLDLRQGRWYPEDEGGGYRDVYAFAQEGHAPQISGPLIRVPQGTKIHAAIHNALALPAKIYGLHTHPGDAMDALRLAPGETRELEFLAGEPGTYIYWASTSDKTLALRADTETMLSGAFVVDTPGTKPDDRIFVLSMWTKDPAAGLQGTIVSINGKSWPSTEHLTYKIGETTHWRVINPTESDHAMHLHGFYFTVDGEGDGERYESYSQEQRLRAVTQHVGSGHVFEMTWTPERAGNWLFHCHMLVHMSPAKALAPKEGQVAAYPSSPLHDRSMGMGGMVLGITVLPGTSAPASPPLQPPRADCNL